MSSGNGYQPSVLFTDVTSDLYYKNGSLGKIEIPTLGLSVRIYQGTDSKTLVKGVGHLRTPPFGRAMSASPPITAAPTAASGGSTRLISAIRSP